MIDEVMKYRWWLLLIGCPVLLLCGGGLLSFGFLVEVPFYLLVGWFPFLRRSVPETTVDWAGVGTGLACLLLLGAGLHFFCSWLYHQHAIRKTSAPPVRTWKIRWTAGFLAVFVLMFVAGIAAVGMTHQTVWLAGSKEKLVNTGTREVSGRFASINNVKQMTIASHTWMDQQKREELPPGATFDLRGRPLHGWQTHFLPYIEHMGTYDSINLQLPWDHPDNEQPYKMEINTFFSPFVSTRQSEDGFPQIHYASNPYVMGGDRSMKFKDITDGTGNTILIGESMGDFQAWRYPLNWRDPALGMNKSLQGFGNPGGQKGAVFGMADGSVRFISDKISPEAYRALFTPAGGEERNDDW